VATGSSAVAFVALALLGLTGAVVIATIMRPHTSAVTPN
jgi:hypothetical protein